MKRGRGPGSSSAPRSRPEAAELGGSAGAGLVAVARPASDLGQKRAVPSVLKADSTARRNEGRHVDSGVAKTTRENPDFVRSYFESSRLHFIGSFRARYESMIASVATRLDRPVADLLHIAPPAATKSRRERVIVHVDMDCFFASVAMRDNPTLRGKPIAVCHGGMSEGSRGGEVSSCSYEARAHGVHAGMFVGRARELCPELQCVPYDFDAYERVSIVIYALFFAISDRVIVQATSIDEAYLDLTDVCKGSTSESPDGVDELVAKLRRDIFSQTGCPASAGVGPSKLLARLATSRAKPNGQLRVFQRDVSEFVLGVDLSSLPGIGWRTSSKLDEMGIRTCQELRKVALLDLQSTFGEKLGRSFYDVCRGIDNEPVEPLKPRKSIGAEISWGVRFEEGDDDKVRDFLAKVANEVAFRCTSVSALGKKVSLKVYKKKPNATLPYKVLGHGPCDIITKSGRVRAQSLSEFPSALVNVCHELYYPIGLRNADFRGVAVQVTDITFLGLRDASSKPPPGRISSFFSAAEKQTKSSQAAPRFSSRGGDIRSNSPDDQVESVDEGAESRSPPDKRRRVAADDEVVPASTEPGGITTQERHAMEVAKHDIVAKALQRGWDPDVFWALPEIIRTELLERGPRDSMKVDDGNALARLPNGALQAAARDAGGAGGDVEAETRRKVSIQGDARNLETMKNCSRGERRRGLAEVDDVDDNEDDDDDDDDEEFDGVSEEHFGVRPSGPGAGSDVIVPGSVPGSAAVMGAEGESNLPQEGDDILGRGGGDQARDFQPEQSFCSPIDRFSRPHVTRAEARPEIEGAQGILVSADRPADITGPAPPLSGGELSASEDENDWSIPSGWDASVFRALPLMIQDELMGQERADRKSRRKQEHARMRARRKQTTLTQLACRKSKDEPEEPVGPEIDEGRVGNVRDTAVPGQDESCIDVPSPPSLLQEMQTPVGAAAPDARWSGLPGGILSQLEMQDAMYHGDGRVYKDESLASYARKLQTWILATSGAVRSAHAELLRSRVLEMVERRELSRAFSEMRMLRRFIEETGGDWIDAFNAVLDDVQTHVVSILNVPLLIRPLPRRPTQERSQTPRL